MTARALQRQLADRFDIRIAYQEEVDADPVVGAMGAWPADLVVDLWWNGKLHRRYGRRTVKQISSHRWAQERFGSSPPELVLQRYANGAGAVVVPSHRLHGLLAGTGAVQVDVAPKGFEPRELNDHGFRRGELEVGWAGASVAVDKHLGILLAAEPRTRLADACLTPLEMGDFYNSIDVIAVSSEAEGDPRTLIEGMACGCFPVTTDVGIAPELVRDGVNGLIVERSPEAFAEAFSWCRANLSHVRAAGRANAVKMRQTRTWTQAAAVWGDVFELALARAA